MNFVTFFKGQFVEQPGVTKRLLLKLISKRLTSALKQTVKARHSFGIVNIFKQDPRSAIRTSVVLTFLDSIYDKEIRANLECHSKIWASPLTIRRRCQQVYEPVHHLLNCPVPSLRKTSINHHHHHDHQLPSLRKTSINHHHHHHQLPSLRKTSINHHHHHQLSSLPEAQKNTKIPSSLGRLPTSRPSSSSFAHREFNLPVRHHNPTSPERSLHIPRTD